MLGGHVARCGDCGHTAISYNSCRNRHCPKCQAGAAREWLEARAADLLPVAYFHVVFTVPAPVAAIALQNKATVYALLFEAAAETLKTIAADPKHLNAEIGATMVLHSWGQTLTHHPHVHCILPGGCLAPDGKTWIACRPGFFLPVRVLSRLYRRLFLDKLQAAHRAGKLRFFNELAPLADTTAFDTHIAPLRRTEWIVYAKRPFQAPNRCSPICRATPTASPSRTFAWRDYAHGRAQKIMRLDAHEFLRRFLLHVLPDGFQRIRHFGFLANGHRRAKLAAIRSLLAVSPSSTAKAVDDTPTTEEPGELSVPCPCCGGTMTIIEVLPGPHLRRWPRLDTS